MVGARRAAMGDWMGGPDVTLGSRERGRAGWWIGAAIETWSRMEQVARVERGLGEPR